MSLTKIGSIGINTGIQFAGITTVSTLKVGSGVTLSSDGDVFFTGIVTATSFSGSGANLTGVLSDIVEDTSPQLGGDLQSNGNDIDFADGDKAIFGTGEDLEIYHSNDESFIDDKGTGNLFIRSNGAGIHLKKHGTTETLATFNTDGNCELYHDNTKIFETGSDQAIITGKLTINRSSNDEKLILSGSNSPYIRFQEGTTNKAYIQWSENGYIILQNDESSKSLRIGTDGAEVSDNVKFTAGDSKDLQIYHDGSHTYANNTTGFFHIRSGSAIRLQKSDGEPMIYAIPDGAVELYHDNSKKLETTSDGASVTGHLNLPDASVSTGRIRMGASDDLQIYHDGTNSYLRNSTGVMHVGGSGGNLVLEALGDVRTMTWEGESMIEAKRNGAVELYYDNNRKFYTESTGVNIYGAGSTFLKMGSEAGGTDVVFFDTEHSSNSKPHMDFRLDADLSLRINSSGDVVVGGNGGAESFSSITLSPDHDDGAGRITFNRADTSGVSIIISMKNASSQVGRIEHDHTSAALVSGSDYRLKENDVAISDGIARLKQLRPIRFNWKSEPSRTVDGFFAHEISSIVPEAVSGEKDAVDSDGNIIIQGISKERLVPLIVAALQEEIAKCEALEARIAALEG